MRRQVSNDAESDETMNVHAELERRKVEAREEGEETVETGDLIEEQGESY